MSTSISSAAMSVDSNGLFGALDPEMGNNLRTNRGIQALIKIYKNIFRIPENFNHYSEKDYRTAERKFLKYSLEQRKIEMEEELIRE
jgi:hypothetical protein